jgi:hypothetical protein
MKFGRRVQPNDLTFGCERTKRNSDQQIMAGAFVGCNGVLGGLPRRLVACTSCDRALTHTSEYGSATHH